MKALQIAIIGAGAVGTTFAVALHEKDYRIVGIASRTRQSAYRCAALVSSFFFSTDPVEVAKVANVILISTPDKVIKEVCDKIAAGGGFQKDDIVIHLSGALGSDILASAKREGAYTLVLHPVQTFPKGQVSAEALSGCYFSLEGDREALEFGQRLVEELGGKAVTIPSEAKPLYHAALCVASNYLVTITDLAVQMLERIGIEKEEALKMIMPLILGTVKNLEKVGLPGALTGPVSRGDLQTVESHLDTIQRLLPEYLKVYKRLGNLTAELARQAGTIKKEDYLKLKKLLVS
jgi:predicted short-subunit dehydrogenase-like oxidoreductase (DUF2520 family)